MTLAGRRSRGGGAWRRRRQRRRAGRWRVGAGPWRGVREAGREAASPEALALRRHPGALGPLGRPQPRRGARSLRPLRRQAAAGTGGGGGGGSAVEGAAALGEGAGGRRPLAARQVRPARRPRAVRVRASEPAPEAALPAGSAGPAGAGRERGWRSCCGSNSSPETRVCFPAAWESRGFPLERTTVFVSLSCPAGSVPVPVSRLCCRAFSSSRRGRSPTTALARGRGKP